MSYSISTKGRCSFMSGILRLEVTGKENWKWYGRLEGRERFKREWWSM